MVIMAVVAVQPGNRGRSLPRQGFWKTTPSRGQSLSEQQTTGSPGNGYFRQPASHGTLSASSPPVVAIVLPNHPLRTLLLSASLV